MVALVGHIYFTDIYSMNIPYNVIEILGMSCSLYANTSVDFR